MSNVRQGTTCRSGENAKGSESQDMGHSRRGGKSPCVRNVLVVFKFSKIGDGCATEVASAWRCLWPLGCTQLMEFRQQSSYLYLPSISISINGTLFFYFGNFPPFKSYLLALSFLVCLTAGTQASDPGSGGWASSVCASQSTPLPSLPAVSCRRLTCMDYITKVSLPLASGWV